MAKKTFINFLIVFYDENGKEVSRDAYCGMLLTATAYTENNMPPNAYSYDIRQTGTTEIEFSTYSSIIDRPWDNVEIWPVIYFPQHESYETTDKESEATHWSVYLHQVEGGIMCYADVETKQDAINLADELAKNPIGNYVDNGYLNIHQKTNDK